MKGNGSTEPLLNVAIKLVAGTENAVALYASDIKTALPKT
jgi:hypothetical protein